MRHPDEAVSRIHHAHGVSGRGITTFGHVACEDPGMAAGDAIRRSAIDSNRGQIYPL